MKLFAKDSQQSNYAWLLFLIAFSLPFPMVFSNWLIGGLALHWLVRGELAPRLQMAFREPMMWLFISLYGIQLLGMLYTHNQAEALISLEHKLTLLALPLIVISSPKLDMIDFNRILKSFIIGCFVSLIIAYCYAIYRRYYLQVLTEYEINNFYLDIPKAFGYSHVYYGLYLVFSFFLICSLFIQTSTRNFVNKLAILCLLSILLLSISVSGGVMSFLGLWIISITVIFVYFTNKNLIKILFAVLPLSSILAFLIFNYNPHFTGRFLQRLDYSYVKIENNPYNYSSTRMAPLKCSLELAKQHWLVGVGSGDLADAMNHWYDINNLQAFQDLDSHNQYLNYLLTFGIGGLSIFLAIIFIPIWKSLQRKSLIYFVFLLLISWCCLSENILSNNKGIIFYSFFNAILAHQYICNKSLGRELLIS